jgi:hypothetical protein
MNKKCLVLIYVVFSLCSLKSSRAQQNQQNNVQKIVIIRHGEKPPEGDNLSCAGLNRSIQLPGALDKKIGAVNVILVPSLKMGKSTGVARMYQTVVPYAIKHGLYINTKYDVDDVEGLVGGIKKQNGTVLVVWEHKHIHKLLQGLGIDSGDKWDDDDYDSIWIVTYKNGKPVLSKDKEGISPSPNCQ